MTEEYSSAAYFAFLPTILIQELNESLSEPVLITQTGGQFGGGSELTEIARNIIAVFEQLTQEAEAATEETRKTVASLLK